MEKANIHGKTEENIKEIIYTIKSMDMVFIHGQMAVNMLGNGLIVKEMAKERLYQ
jgi:hypothetical protein